MLSLLEAEVLQDLMELLLLVLIQLPEITVAVVVLDHLLLLQGVEVEMEGILLQVILENLVRGEVAPVDL